MKLIPKNWKSFQHYKHRSPPWVKLHRSLLDDFDYQCLPVASRALAPMLWLLASESDDGTIEATREELAFRLRMGEKDFEDALKPLINKGFFKNDSKALAKPKQSAVPEIEKSKSRDREEKRESLVLASKPAPKGNGTDGTLVWDSYSKAYFSSYGIEPKRNAKINSLCKQLVKRLGKKDAVALAGWYPFRKGGTYKRSKHCMDLLVRDAEGLYTEWATGKQVTDKQAREEDTQASKGQVWQNVILEADYE